MPTENHLFARCLKTVNMRRVAKGQKPLGAAFSFGRREARDRKQRSHEDVLRHANRWLKENGHPPVKNGKVSKGLLDRFRSLTPAERIDFGILQELGFSKEEARALAQAGTSGAVRKAETSGYHQAYVAEAKARLPLDVHASIHKLARARAGGLAKAQAMTAAQTEQLAQEGQDKVEELWRKRLKEDAGKVPGSDQDGAHQEVVKAGPSLDEVSNFGAPGFSRAPKKKEAADDSLTPPKGVQSACRRGLELAPEYGGPGLTEGAKARARSMANGSQVSMQTLKRIRAYHARHTETKESSPPSPGYVAYLLWGGSAGRSWANAKIEKTAQQVPITKRADPADDLCEEILRTILVKQADPIDTLADGLLTAVLKSAEVQQNVADNALAEDADLRRLRSAQDLVTRMDDVLASSDVGVEEARKRASDQLARQSHGDGQPASGSNGFRNTGGLRLDLNAGSNRQPGFLSLDTYAHDFGTVLHDIELGLPVPDASCDAIRLVDAFGQHPALAQNPLPILQEAQRALTYGGTLTYQGPTLTADTLQELPGLVVKQRLNVGEGQEHLNANRVQAQLPAVYGADTALLSQREATPADIAAAKARYGLMTPPAQLAMANLLTKSEARPNTSVGVTVVKKDSWEQIVYGVVLAPDEEDSQGDTMSAAEIQKTAHKYLASQIVGQEHLGPMESATVVESYIAPQDLSFADAPAGIQLIPRGAWVLGVHIEDKRVWQDVLDKKFTGFSVGGFGDRTPLPS